MSFGRAAHPACWIKSKQTCNIEYHDDPKNANPNPALIASRFNHHTSKTEGSNSKTEQHNIGYIAIWGRRARRLGKPSGGKHNPRVLKCLRMSKAQKDLLLMVL